MSDAIHRLFLCLRFPAGLSPGEGKEGNYLTVARDGSGRPVLRGSALAGALRHAYARRHGHHHEDADVSDWFGESADGDSACPSRLTVPDCVLLAGEQTPLPRTYNAHDRHTGAVRANSLFSLEALPPGTRANVCLWLEADSEKRGREFLEDLSGCLRTGLTLGGNGARGLGQVELCAPALHRFFDCSDLVQYAALLDEQYDWRAGQAPSTGNELVGESIGRGSLHLRLVLTVPRGEDFLVGDGQGLDYQLEPQRIRCADGSERWRLPGSSLRGVLRGWMTHLAAKAGRPVADSLERFREQGSAPGSELAWGFRDARDREAIQNELADDPSQLEKLIPCPIMRLFGSSFSKGRIHISDSISEEPVNETQRQARTHVAVDRLTGGANEGFLFTTAVLAGRVRFPVTITVENPSEIEARWLLASLRAIDLGVVRIGSSKAGGRLALARRPEASGRFADLFSALVPGEV